MELIPNFLLDLHSIYADKQQRLAAERERERERVRACKIMREREREDYLATREKDHKAPKTDKVILALRWLFRSWHCFKMPN